MPAPAATKMTAAEIAAIEPVDDRLRVRARALLLTNDAMDEFLSRADGAQKELLDGYLAAEIALRERNRTARRIKAARFPARKSFEGYEWGAVGFPGDMTKDDLMDLSFMDRAENIVCMGPVGTGKTHLMIALGERACAMGREVRYFTVSAIVSALVDAKARGGVSRLLKSLARCDALLLDEFGYVPIDRDGARLLFQVVSDAYERQSLIVTTNIDFSRWGTILADDQMASAVIDRIAHHGHLLVFEGESYRLRHALMRQ